MANNVKFKSPALPIPPAQYNQSLYQRTFSVLRLYFNQLDEHLRQDLGDTTINGDLTVTGGVTAGATTINGELNVNSNTLKLTSIDPNSTTENPSIELFRDSPTPAASGSEIGAVKFFGTNNNASTPEKFEYAGIYAETEYPVDGNEQGALKFKLGHGGGQEDPAMSLFSYGLQMGYGNPILMSYSNGYMQFFSPNAAQKSFKLNATPNATVANGAYDIYLPDLTSGTLAVTNSSVAFTAGDTTINGDLTVNADLLKVVSTDAGAVENPILALYRNSSSIAPIDEIGAVEFRGNDAEGAEFVYGRIYSELSVVGSGSEQANLRFALGRSGGIEDPVMVLRQYALEMQAGNDIYLSRTSDIIFEGDTTNGNETHLYVVDPTADRTILLPDADGTIALTTMTAPLTINSTTTSADLVIRNNENSSADASPIVELYRAQSVGADGEDLGKIEFYGSNDRGFSSGGPEKILYASVYTEIGDASDGSEDGNLRYSKVVAGAQQLGDLVTQPLNGGVQFPAQSAAPSSPANGQVYYDTDDHKLKLYANGSFVDLN